MTVREWVAGVCIQVAGVVVVRVVEVMVVPGEALLLLPVLLFWHHSLYRTSHLGSGDNRRIGRCYPV